MYNGTVDDMTQIIGGISSRSCQAHPVRLLLCVWLRNKSARSISEITERSKAHDS